MSDEVRNKRFADKVSAAIDAEQDPEGLGGLLIGYGVGYLLGTGSTQEEIREVFEKAMAMIVLSISQGGDA